MSKDKSLLYDYQLEDFKDELAYVDRFEEEYYPAMLLALRPPAIKSKMFAISTPSYERSWLFEDKPEVFLQIEIANERLRRMQEKDGGLDTFRTPLSQAIIDASR